MQMNEFENDCHAFCFTLTVKNEFIAVTKVYLGLVLFALCEILIDCIANFVS